jgi:hypothetical protein
MALIPERRALRGELVDAGKQCQQDNYIFEFCFHGFVKNYFDLI